MNLAFWNFNFFYSFLFWISFLLVSLTARLFDSSPKLKLFFLGLASSIMLLAIPQFNVFDLGLVLILAIFTYFMGSLLMRSASAVVTLQRKLIAGVGILVVLAFLAFFKYSFVQSLFLPSQIAGITKPASVLRLIGVSYFSFRIIHFLVESYRKKIEYLSLLSYFNYIIFFPAFISGPINRYNHFATQFNSRSLARPAADLMAGGGRIVNGLFKKLVLAQILYPYILAARPETLAQMRFLDVVLGLYAYAFYFYFDFSGYTDLALGCARVIGIELPENFNSPFLKRNLRELWTNWHMSLTSWLVDYIYWPIVRKFRSLDYFRRHPVLLSNLGMIITFIVCGMWHGETANFILWGAYHGFGIAVLTIYQREKRKVRLPFLQKYIQSKTSTVLGTILTFNFFAFGLALFVLDLEKLRILAAAVLSGR